MREIKLMSSENSRFKFRAWHPHRKMMQEHDSRIKSIENFFGSFYTLDIGESVLMQYTGLKDRNFVEIYEGDIVTGSYHNLDVDYSKFGKVKMGYTHDSDGWSCGQTFGWISSNGSSLADLVDCEVIGNIHENPELLEATQRSLGKHQ